MIVALKELGDISTGNTPSKKVSEYYDSDDIYFVKPDIISDTEISIISNSSEYISEKARGKARIVSKDSIFVTCIGTIGKIGIASDGDYAFNQQINAIKPNNRIIPKYLAYNLFYSKSRLNAISNAPVVPIINKSQFSEFTLNIETDKSKQSEIVSTLDKLQSIITHRQKQLEKLDELIKSRFVEMFGDVIVNNRNWNANTWNDVLTIKNGKNQKQVENPNGLYAICGSGGIMGYADEYITSENSVIIGRKGNINKPILMREKFWNVDTAFGLEPNTAMINVDYLYNFCVCFDFDNLNKAVTIPSLTKADLLKIDIPVPPLELQNQFAAFVEQTDKSKAAVQKALDEAQLLFDSLMQKYFG